nr:probable inactive heme oxygenase 2, chloroplastic [Ipomoea trifida]
MACYTCAAVIGANPTPIKSSTFQIFTPNDCLSLPIIPTIKKIILRTNRPLSLSVLHCSSSSFSSATLSQSETEDDEYSGEEEDDENGNGSASFSAASAATGSLPPLKQKRRRYRKQYPGESKGITEEMRFVTMKLRNSGKPSKSKRRGESEKESGDSGSEEAMEEGEVSDSEGSVSVDEDEGDGNGKSWQPSMEGFLKYLVDTKLVFGTIERIVDESSDVSYAYFRKTGLERADCISKDLEWFSQQGNVIPEPSNPGGDYSKYLEELAETNPPLFLCHFYNIYFSHIAGGQVIAKKVSEKLLEGRVLEIYTWEGDPEKQLQGVREKLNMLSEHWSRKEKNKCLRDIPKAFRFMGQIVRLIVFL